MTLDPDVRGVAISFGIDPRLLQAVVNAEGNIVRAVQCSIPSVTTREEALKITARSCVHAMTDYIREGGQAAQTDFVAFWAKRWAPVGATNDPTSLNGNWPKNVIAGWLAVLVLLLWSQPAFAQFGSGWNAPMTPATEAVKGAVAGGLCDQAAVDYIRAQGQAAVVTNAGAPWPSDRHVIMWYRKGPNCNGAFQYVSEADGGGDRGPSGGYRGGWEISWDPNSYIPGPGDATHPTGGNADHPTAWRFSASSAFDPSFVSGPVSTPPPVITPPTVTPTPQPVIIDVAAIIAKLNEIESQNVALEAKLEAAVNNPSWFKQVFGNQYVQLALTGIGTYFATKATK